jgi:hypothetical protein
LYHFEIGEVNMKNIMMYIACLVLVTSVINCQNQKNSKNNDQNMALTPAPPPPTTNCLYSQNGTNNQYGNQYGSNYNNNAGYNNYSGYNGYSCNYTYGQYNGFNAYNFQYDNFNGGQNYYMGGFCGCPVNFRPIYNSYWGLGCIEGRFVNTTAYFIGYGWTSTNNQWINIPQISTMPVSGSNCYQDAVLACDTQNPMVCGTGGICVSPNGGRTGVCQYQNGYNYYNNNWWGNGTR